MKISFLKKEKRKNDFSPQKKILENFSSFMGNLQPLFSVYGESSTVIFSLWGIFNRYFQFFKK